MLQKLALLDSRIVLDRNEKNSKICLTLNKAWSKAKGYYIARMDGDDISLPKRLEVLKQYLDDHSDIDLVGSQVISINENGEVDILTILVKAGLEKSRGDARRDVVQGGVTVDGEKVQDFKAVFTKDDLKDGKLVKRGKKSFKLVKC